MTIVALWTWRTLNINFLGFGVQHPLWNNWMSWKLWSFFFPLAPHRAQKFKAVHIKILFHLSPHFDLFIFRLQLLNFRKIKDFLCSFWNNYINFCSWLFLLPWCFFVIWMCFSFWRSGWLWIIVIWMCVLACKHLQICVGLIIQMNNIYWLQKKIIS